MKKMFKRITAILLVTALACGMFGAMPVEAASSPKFQKKVTTFLYSTKSGASASYVIYELWIKNCPAKPKSVKSSNSKVTCMQTDYYKGTKEARIVMNTKYECSTKISFKINGKSYSSKITFLPYSNPASTVKITGVNGGKNIASGTKKSWEGYYSLKKSQSNAKLTVKAKSGWKLTGVTLRDTSKDKVIYSKTLKGTSKKKSFTLGSLKKSKDYYLSLSFENKGNGGIVEIGYYL